jgi:hypothetical protein
METGAAALWPQRVEAGLELHERRHINVPWRRCGPPAAQTRQSMASLHRPGSFSQEPRGKPSTNRVTSRSAFSCLKYSSPNCGKWQAWRIGSAFLERLLGRPLQLEPAVQLALGARVPTDHTRSPLRRPPASALDTDSSSAVSRSRPLTATTVRGCRAAAPAGPLCRKAWHDSRVHFDVVLGGAALVVVEGNDPLIGSGQVGHDDSGRVKKAFELSAKLDISVI